MDKYRNKYRRQSTRLPYWDYSANALYFLTIVTQHRKCILGEVVNGEMVLSEMGQIVDDEFLKSFEIRDELLLHEYIIMPNHLHTIVEIRKPNLDSKNFNNSVETHGNFIDSGDFVNPVETHGRASQQDYEGRASQQDYEDRASQQDYEDRASQQDYEDRASQLNQRDNQRPFVRLPKSISSFIAGFKSAVNTQIDNYIDEHNLQIPKYNRNNHFFQPNYNDRVIRNKAEYYRIKNYIIQNPKNWDKDDLN